ncbi:hypothetical protein V501_10201 [Pseudogymnoascus sp. VKM F-4519 (FW-2642)]|nr:hypothetical protein V501_10201 [Pseudogymnoascus sp. VKM F-4519 (FW-2642)]
MHTSFILTAVVAIGAATGASASAMAPRAALPKANELTSPNCAPGTGSYEHHSAFLGDVTMNDGSHSVYFAAGPWDFFSGKTKEGGYCTGDWIGRWADDSHPCVNLDTAGSNGRRIKVSTGHADGSFASPGVAVKPKFRYWLPDASIDPAGFADDIAQLAKRGAGGTELLNYFCLPTSVTPSNWDIYGYGAPGYSKIVKVALEAHRDAGILFDYAHSANGCVPAKKGNPGLSWQLDYYSTTNIGNFSGTVPGWGKGEFIGAVTFAVTNVGTHPADFHGAFGWGKSYPAYTISNASLTDATSLIDSKGFIETNPTLTSDAQYYVIQAYYAVQPLERELAAWSSNPQTIFQNGSVAVDHFSAVGAKVITNFMEDYVLIDGVKELFQQVGKNLWEDSLEISGDTYWTPGLLDKFETRYGMGYNTPMDMLQTMTDVDLPEAETLSFSNQIDSYLQVAGPADLAGKLVISVELGADWHQAYYQSWELLLFDAKHAFAGGINQVVIHGAAYSHNFTDTTWPGYTTHKYDYPGQHSRHQPAWDVGYPEALAYLGRVHPRRMRIHSPLYWFDDLTKAGYTHEYLSPANFVLEKAAVRNKVFAPNAQAAKAIIIRGNDTLTPDGVQYLATYAEAGLPIVISGGLPSKYGSGNQAAVSKAKATFQGLLSRSNVHQVPLEGLAASIKSIGITPRVQVQSNGSWYPRWRETSSGDIYVWIYNDGADSTGSLTFATTGTPYFLNAWTGEEELIFEYTATSFNVQLLGSLIQAKVAYSTSLSTVSTSFGLPQTFRTTDVQPAYTLNDWSLVIEHWGPPDNLYNLDLDAKKENLTVPIDGPSLKSWKHLGFPDVSGIGFYRTTFEWSPSLLYSTGGAYLILPPVSDGIVGTLNGKRLPAFDITNPTADIKSYLKKGENVLEFKVSSTLKNSLKPIWDNLRTAGGGVASSWDATAKLGFGLQDYGLIGEVQIIPYGLVPIW